MNEKVLDKAIEYWREVNGDPHRWASFTCSPSNVIVTTGVVHYDGVKEQASATRAFFLSVDGDEVKSITWEHL